MYLAQMLARNAEIYPGNTALIDVVPSKKWRRQTTWSQLNQRADRIANALIDKGVKKGDRVLHLMWNSSYWLEAYFGIIKTGAWAVPLNFRFMSPDIKYCANVAEAKAFIVQERFKQRVDAIRSDPELATIEHYIWVSEPGEEKNPLEGWENFEELAAKSSAAPVEVELEDDDGCALYFTSGTTGKPKPILLSQLNLEKEAFATNAYSRYDRSSNELLVAPFYHTGAKMFWFGCLLVGARGTILQEFSPQNLLETMAREGGTSVFITVPWAIDILNNLERGTLKKENYDLGCWCLTTFGAQPVPPDLLKRWGKHFPRHRVANVYGLSESSGPCCIYLRPEDQAKAITGTVGKVAYGWKAQIVSTEGKDVSIGEVGELLIKGNVMKGYYKNPEGTAEAIENGWLHTGDIAKMDGEGFIWIVDRAKDVIISGGENIYPLEVEGVLHKNPKISDVAVIGYPDERMVEVPVAIVELKPGESATEEEFMAFCEQNLPKYKRPRKFIFNKVPRNPTGKIEKPALREKYVGKKS